MANLGQTVPENVPGEFFVDRSCIDCDACRGIAPSVFARSDPSRSSFVQRQPGSPEEMRRAAMALVTCPTSSIGTVHKVDVGPGVRSLPEPLTTDVYFCGYASEASFGALSYFVRRPDGNVLVDSPRAAGPLLKRVAELGGIRWMFLSHRDDVADHARFAERFACRRILHRLDVSRRTQAVEEQPEGDEPIQLADDLTIIPVPGHTAGSCVLLYQNEFLFTGDHLSGNETNDGLEAWPEVCWYSWPAQIRSMERLLDFKFSWVLPGHGRQFRAQSPQHMRRELEHLVASMKRQS